MIIDNAVHNAVCVIMLPAGMFKCNMNDATELKCNFMPVLYIVTA